MGWSLSSVIIHSKTNINHKELLNKLGFDNLVKIEDQPYDFIMNPEPNQVYIGTYKNNLIIAADNLSIQFYMPALSNAEKILIDSFPGAEICAVSLQSAVNHFGFAVIKNGEKIRVKAGDADLGTAIDIGQPSEEELPLLQKSSIDSNGQRRYVLNDHSDELFFEHQVGENFVFEIFKRYTGEQMDMDDDLLDTNFSGYSFSNNQVAVQEHPFTGEWEGEYAYGDGYKETTRGRKEIFHLNILVEADGHITGHCADDNKPGDAPATVTGFIIDDFIGFIKKYPFRYVQDEKGQTQKDTSQPPRDICYSGLYDILTDSFRGVWHIDQKKFWGEWTMKRKE